MINVENNNGQMDSCIMGINFIRCCFEAGQGTVLKRRDKEAHIKKASNLVFRFQEIRADHLCA